MCTHPRVSRGKSSCAAAFVDVCNVDFECTCLPVNRPRFLHGCIHLELGGVVRNLTCYNFVKTLSYEFQTAVESKKRFIIIKITEFITTALSLLPGNTKRPFSNVSIWPKLAAKHAAGDPCENPAHTPVSARKCCWLGCTTGIASDCYYYRRGTKYFYTEPGIATLVHLTGGQNHKPHTHTHSLHWQ